MALHFVIGLLLLGLSTSTFAQDGIWSQGQKKECWLSTQHPRSSLFVLSNSVEVSIPTVSCAFDMAMIVGLMDSKAVATLLKEQDLYPITVKGKAIGLLSSYHYRQSDIGPFQEIYFVMAATPKANLSDFESLGAFFKSISYDHNNQPSKDIYFYHHMVFSSTQTAKLMSKEIWGIDSKLAQIHYRDVNGPSFKLQYLGQNELEAKLENGPWVLNPLGVNFVVLATGAKENGKRLVSPVKGRGMTWASFFNPRWHKLKFNHGPFADVFESLKFNPQLIQWGRDLSAVQFPPLE